MESRSLIRPATQLLKSTLSITSQSQSSSSKLLRPLGFSRGHKTASRTKRALKIPPHESFLPSRTNPATTDTIIYNPPSSEASPHHTPFIFLPRGDPRRMALIQSRGLNPGAPAVPNANATLPPEMKYLRRDPKSHVTIEDIREMRRLRTADPLTWSAGALAKKFQCSPTFVSVCAPAPREHLRWLEEKLERKKARWGPKKTQAKEERKMRTVLMYQGKL